MISSSKYGNIFQIIITFNYFDKDILKVKIFRGGTMSYRDQKKYMEALKRHERNFDRRELEEYKIFLKRDKDEEEFDTLSMKRLKELYDKYNITGPKKDYSSFFKKKEE